MVFKEPLPECFFVETKMVILWYRCGEPKSVDMTRLLASSFDMLLPAAYSNCCLFWGVSVFTLLFSW